MIKLSEMKINKKKEKKMCQAVRELNMQRDTEMEKGHER